MQGVKDYIQSLTQCILPGTTQPQKAATETSHRGRPLGSDKGQLKEVHAFVQQSTWKQE